MLGCRHRKRPAPVRSLGHSLSMRSQNDPLVPRSGVAVVSGKIDGKPLLCPDVSMKRRKKENVETMASNLEDKKTCIYIYLYIHYCIHYVSQCNPILFASVLFLQIHPPWPRRAMEHPCRSWAKRGAGADPGDSGSGTNTKTHTQDKAC